MLEIAEHCWNLDSEASASLVPQEGLHTQKGLQRVKGFKFSPSPDANRLAFIQPQIRRARMWLRFYGLGLVFRIESGKVQSGLPILSM